VPTFDPTRKRRHIPAAVRLIVGLLVFVLVGALLLSLPISSMGKSLTMQQSLFTSVSALAVTGLSTITPAVDLSPTGKVILMALIQFGGIGYMVLAILVFRLLGRSISLTERMALQDALGLINLQGIVQLSIRVFFTVLTIEFIGAICLFINWSNVGPIAHRDPGYVAFYAIFHSVSSFCNAGFDLFNGKYAFPLDGGTMLIMSVLIIVGGLGIPVLFDVLTYRTRKKLSLHTRLTALAFLGLIVWGGIAIWLGESMPGGKLDGLNFGRQASLSLFQSVSCRTAGYSALGGLDGCNPATQLVMITLMFIGCAPASMGGGITTGTFIVMMLAMVAYIRRQSTPIVYGRAIPGEMVRKAAAVLTISLFVVVTSSWLIMMSHPEWTMGESVFEIVSAFATCGLTLSKTSDLNDFGQGVVMFMMFWGRLGALTILFAFTRPKSSRRVSYPEEKILLG